MVLPCVTYRRGHEKGYTCLVVLPIEIIVRNIRNICKRSRMIRDIRFPFFLYFCFFFCFFLWYSLFFNNNIDTRNNKYKYKYKYQHRLMDFNHTSSHFTYAYDTNIHVWVWHEWEVWFELWLKAITTWCNYLKYQPNLF